MDEVKFSDWMKLDLRVGKILKVEDIENADKLYKLEVDLGEELGKRTLVAGLKQHYKKQELKGKNAVFFVNLEPKEMKGVKSEGMILAAVSGDFRNAQKGISDSAQESEDSRHESKIKLIVPDDDIEVGSKIS